MLEGNNPDHSWPADGLEAVAACPLCGSADRTLAYPDLRDWCFECAPGAWSLYQCRDCACGYLDPRPNAATIGVAYSRYYTHTSYPEPVSQMRRFWHRLRADYLKASYGASDVDALWPGRWLVRMFPVWRQGIDAAHGRNLPRIEGESPSLLDIGCGNGHFLEFARSAGWQVRGIDLDPAAVVIARTRGLDVLEGTIGLLDAETSMYDYITLSHILEHVYDPQDLLRNCYRLLKPGGMLWLDTPNMHSAGRASFGAFWRGLEPPRHLMLFSRTCLREMLASIGFLDVQDKFSSLATKMMWRESRKIMKNAGIAHKARHTWVGQFNASLQALYSCDTREFITLICRKKDAS